MSNNQIIGIVVLVVGVVLLAAGFNEYGSFGSKLGRALGSGMRDRTLFLFVAGGVCTAVGAVQLFRK